MFMATLIKNKQITQDHWQTLDSQGETPHFESSTAGDWLVPLSVWTAQSHVLCARGGRNGVILQNTDDPQLLVNDFDRLALIAVHFPKFTDGRGYSVARLLRRLGWKGELRAVGDVLRDQLFYMTRCGFDAFLMRADQDGQSALKSFKDFSVPYQPAIDAGFRFVGDAKSVASAPSVVTVNPW